MYKKRNRKRTRQVTGHPRGASSVTRAGARVVQGVMMPNRHAIQTRETTPQLSALTTSVASIQTRLRSHFASLRVRTRWTIRIQMFTLPTMTETAGKPAPPTIAIFTPWRSCGIPRVIMPIWLLVTGSLKSDPRHLRQR